MHTLAFSKVLLPFFSTDSKYEALFHHCGVCVKSQDESLPCSFPSKIDVLDGANYISYDDF